MTDDAKVLFVEWCAADALGGTQNMEPLTELAYRRIIDMIYSSNDNLLDDDKVLQYSTKTGTKWKAIKQALIEVHQKIYIEDGKIRHRKCTEKLEKSRKNIEQKRVAQAAMIEARKAKNNDLADESDENSCEKNGDPVDEKNNGSDNDKSLKDNETGLAAASAVATAAALANQEPKNPKKKESPYSPPRGDRFAEEFEKFWKAYRRTPNMSKKKARAGWDRIAGKLAPPEDLIRSVGLYNDWLDAQGAKAPPVCHASTFLNEHRFQGFLDQAAPADPDTAPKMKWAKLRPQDWHDRVLAAIGGPAYRSWIAPLWLEGDVIHCPSRFVMDWVKTHYQQAIERAIGRGIVFTLDPTPPHALLDQEHNNTEGNDD